MPSIAAWVDTGFLVALFARNDAYFTSAVEFLLRQRFGELPGWVEALLRRAAPEEVETWGVRVLSAGSLEEVFGGGGEAESRPH